MPCLFEIVTSNMEFLDFVDNIMRYGEPAFRPKEEPFTYLLLGSKEQAAPQRRPRSQADTDDEDHEDGSISDVGCPIVMAPVSSGGGGHVAVDLSTIGPHSRHQRTVMTPRLRTRCATPTCTRESSGTSGLLGHMYYPDFCCSVCRDSDGARHIRWCCGDFCPPVIPVTDLTQLPPEAPEVAADSDDDVFIDDGSDDSDHAPGAVGSAIS